MTSKFLLYMFWNLLYGFFLYCFKLIFYSNDILLEVWQTKSLVPILQDFFSISTIGVFLIPFINDFTSFILRKFIARNVSIFILKLWSKNDEETK